MQLTWLSQHCYHCTSCMQRAEASRLSAHCDAALHAGPHPQQGLPAHLDLHSFSSGQPRADEYSDDDDAGYLTIPVTRQDEFVLTELQLSDDEASPTRSSFGYHRCWLQECVSLGVACLGSSVSSVKPHAGFAPCL